MTSRPDDCAAATAAGLDRLPADDAGFVRSVLTDEQDTPTDGERIARFLEHEADPTERGLFLAYCSARAGRIVVGLLPMIEALIPLAFRNPILTGSELEAGIAALVYPPTQTQGD